MPGYLFPGLLLFLYLPLLLAVLLLEEGGDPLLLLLLLPPLLVPVQLTQHLEGVGHLLLLVVQHHGYTLLVGISRLARYLLQQVQHC